MKLYSRPLNLVFTIIFVLLASCRDEPKINPEIAALPIETQVDRFDLKFGQAQEADLSSLKRAYPQFFPRQFTDSVWIAKKRDTLLQALHGEVETKFQDFDEYTEDLNLLFKHAKHYFPNFEPPTVYTVISEVSYNNKVLSNGREMIIGLDNYLGADHPFYEGIPRYVVEGMEPTQIVPDVAQLIARTYVPEPKDRTFLGQMVYHGKVLYLKSLLLPQMQKSRIIGYSQQKMDWAKENEVDIWRYFIEKEVLFSTETKLQTQFINPAPFSKFYLELDSESPGRIGRYMGWQMVQAFAENTSANLSEVLSETAVNLYQRAKYKPKK